MIKPEDYLKVTGLRVPKQGGQELILYEILALLDPYVSVWVPFDKDCKSLVDALVSTGHVVFGSRVLPKRAHIDAVYFGTPTIVDGRPLFANSARHIKTKQDERDAVRQTVLKAKDRGARRIVSGLGSGDISTAERRHDLGRGAMVVVTKEFEGFTDWVIVRDV